MSQCSCHSGCGCHKEKETSNVQLIISALTIIPAFLTEHFLAEISFVLALILSIALFIAAAWSILKNAYHNVIVERNNIFDENMLIIVAAVAAFIIGYYAEAIAVAVFFTVGEWLQDKAVDRSRRSILDLSSLIPEQATVVTSHGEKKILPEMIKIGDIISLVAGERVPVDGVVIEGGGYFDTKAITGESIPQTLTVGDKVYSGSICLDSAVKIRADETIENSVVSRIMAIIEDSEKSKATAEKFITRFAGIYTPIVIGLAVVIFVLRAFILKDAAVSEALYNAMIFLVISCPCSLVISIPLSYFAGIGRSSRDGILVKGGNVLDKLCVLKYIGMDKTGTLTEGTLSVDEVYCSEGFSQDEVIKAAKLCEAKSNHIIAKAICDYSDIIVETGDSYTELAGKGIICKKDNDTYYCGNKRLMLENGIRCDLVKKNITCVLVAENNKLMGAVYLSDKIKSDALEAVKELNRLSVKTEMFSGDVEDNCCAVASQLGLTGCNFELLPHDKVSRFTERKALMLKDNQTAAFVGDGINDAPVMSAADIGIAMGGIGAAVAVEEADIVIMNDDLVGIAKAIKISRKTKIIAIENIVISVGFKAAIMLLSVFGIGSIWTAVFADVGVALVAVLNSLRIMRMKL